MSTKWVVDSSQQLQEVRETGFQPQNPVIRVVAKIISYVFHPLFVPVYLIVFLVFTPPFFSGFTKPAKMMTILQFFMLYTFFPLVTVLLAKGLGFIESVYLKGQKERIIPYIATGIYYFWMAYVLRNQSQYASEVVQLAMAIFIASSLALIANIYMKISMHAISMGILLVFMGMLAVNQSANYSFYIALSLVTAGLVCSSRLIISDHSSREIYAGLLLGGLSQLIAVWADAVLP